MISPPLCASILSMVIGWSKARGVGAGVRAPRRLGSRDPALRGVSQIKNAVHGAPSQPIGKQRLLLCAVVRAYDKGFS